MLDFANFQLGIIACAIKDTEFLKVIAHKLEPEDFKEGSKIIDCWRILDTKFKNQSRVKYIAVGYGPNE